MRSIRGWRLGLAGMAYLGLTTATAAAAAAAGDSYAFKIGAYAAYALKDGQISTPNDGKLFGMGHSPEEISTLLKAAGAPPDHLDLSIQPLLVQAGPRTLLFDSGAGAFMGAAAGQLMASMSLAKVAPAQVTDIFISHGHGDHVGGLIKADGTLSLRQCHHSPLEARMDLAQGPDAGRHGQVRHPPARGLGRRHGPEDRRVRARCADYFRRGQGG